MKKLMIAAAAAAMISGVQAATFAPGDCGADVPPTETPCPVMVFKLTASGKTVQDVNEGEYKAVTSLKISKGALAFLYNQECAEDAGVCCYDAANLYAQVKVGKKTSKIAIAEVAITKWSVFGKKLDQALAWKTDIKKGKSVKLESDLELTAEDGTYMVWSDEDEAFVDSDNELVFQAVAFGNFTCKVVYKKASTDNSACDKVEEGEVCEATWTPGNYSGWFVGNRTLVNDAFACFNCDCGEYDLFGGTWKAVFQKKLASDEAAQKLAFGKVLIAEEE